MTKVAPRFIHEIAADIRKDWGSKVSPYAKPYLDAMMHLSNVQETYFHDSGRSVVSYFLANAGTYRGANAKVYKDELRAMVK